MLSTRLSFFIYLFSFILICCPASAQQIPAAQLKAIEKSQQDIISQEEQRREDYLRDLHKKAPPKAEEELKFPDKAESKTSNMPKNLTFQSIHIKGVTCFPQWEIQRLAAPFVNKAISLDDINILIRLISNKFTDKGYSMARVYLEEQNLKSEKLIITVNEGHLTDSDQEDFKGVSIIQNGEKRANGQNAFPAFKHKVFNMRDYEQGIDQINRLKAYQSTIEMSPGEKVGETDVIIVTEKDKSGLFGGILNGSFQADNGGSNATGIQQQTLNLNLEDAYGAYETIGFTFKHDMGANGGDKQNRSFSGNLSVPFGYWTFRWVTDYYDYLQTQITSYQSFKVTGENTSHTAEIERIIHRDNLSKTGLTGSITHKHSLNYINNVKLITNSRRLTIAGMRLFHTRRLWQGSLSGSLSYDQGLDVFGAEHDRGKDKHAPKAQFKRIKADMNFYKPLRLGTQNFAWSLSGNGMYSPDILLNSENQNIGGHHSVRGFWDQSLSGNTGGYIRNELSWHLPQITTAPIRTLISNPELYIGYDHGWIHKNRSSEGDHGSLSGFGFGLRTRASHIFSEVGFERALDYPSTIRSPEKRVFFKLGITF